MFNSLKDCLEEKVLLEKKTCGGLGLASHLQDGPGRVQGGGGGPEGLAGDGANHLGSQVSYIYLRPPSFFSVKRYQP